MINQKEPKNINNAHKAFKFVLRWEGGDRYTNDPKDPGGETKYGISKRAHPTLDIKHLTPEKALEIYLEKYWFPSGADDLDFPMCLLVFDTAFLCGVGRAASWLRITKNPDEYLALRKTFHMEVAQKNEWARKFIKGWLNRTTDLKRVIDEAEMKEEGA
jgi:Glycosyl hydrolase 108